MVNLNLRPRALFAALTGFALVVNILVLLIPHADLVKITLGFIWLFLIPGWLITRIIKLDTPSAWERLAFTVGFSVLALMASGLLINTVIPLVGINHPMGTSELLFGLDVIWTVLAGLALLPRRTDPLVFSIPKLNRSGVWITLAAAPMLVLTVLGAISLNNGGTGAYTYLMLLYATGYLALLTVKREKLPESALLAGIYTVGLCALLMTSLRGWYTTGHDIQREYQVFLITLSHLKWDISFYQDAYNACMSITILPTIVRQIMGINEVFVYKTVFQVLFAMVPVLVYLTARRYSNRLVAMLAAIYFIAFPTYAQDMPMLNRQEIAFIFMGLIFLTIFNDTWSLKRRRWLVAMLGLGVVLSHYSTTYTMLTIFLMVVALRYVMRMLGNFFSKNTSRRTMTFSHWRRMRPAPLNLAIVVFLLGASYIWSTQLTNTGGNITRVAGETVAAIVKGVKGDSQSSDTNYSLFSHSSLTDQQRLQAYADKTVPKARKDIPTKDLYPESSYNGYKLQIAPTQNQPLTPFGHTVQDLGIPVSKFDELTRTGSAIFLQLALGVGILLLFLARPFATRLNSEYRLFQLAQVFLLAAIVVLPVLSAEYGLLRAFQQILLLSGAAIAFATLTLIPSALKRTRVWLPAFLAILFFASSTGLITTALGGYPAQLHLANSGKYYDLYYAHTSEQQAMSWLSNAENHGGGSNNLSTSIMTDRYTFDRIEQFKKVSVAGDNIYPGVVTRDSYVFLGYTTTTQGVATAFYNNDPLTYYYPVGFLDGNKDEVYASQGARIYR
jgi:uncharacterized membrane protein